MARKLVVEIVGDASSLEKSFKRASNSAKGFDRDLNAATRGAVAGSGAFAGMGRSVAFASGSFLGGVGLLATVKSTVNATSNLEESVNAVNVVFGDAAGTILDFSEKAVTKAGLSMREFNQLATPVGALLQNTGDSAQEAAEKTLVLTQRAADMASVFNTPVAQALEAIQSALRGEADPIEVFGVKLNEAAVNAEVMRLGLANSVGDIDEAAKAQARYSLILQQTAKFQGDFARTADSAANRTKILKANIEDLQASLGEDLIPLLSDAIGLLNKFAEARQDIRGQPGGKFFFGTIGDQFRAFKDNVEDVLDIIGVIDQKAPATLEDVRVGFTQLGREISTAIGSVAARAFELRGQFGPTPEEASRGRAAREALRQRVQDEAQLAVDRTALTDTVTDDIRALQELNALLLRRIRGGHDTIELQREQLSVELQLKDLLARQAEARKAARAAAREQARERRDTRQFRLLGLGPGGEALVPGVANLKRQLGGVMDAIEGSFLDTNKTRARLRNIQRVLAEGIGNVSKDVRRQIQEILADLRNQLKKSSVDVTRFQHSARGQLTLAGATPRMGGTIITGGVHLHGVQNVQQMEEALAKRRKQRARQRRSTR